MSAEPFKEMAHLIEHNSPERFAGAIVVVPPGDGEPIAFMLSDPRPDIVQFWATVKARVEVKAAEALQAASDAQQRSGGAWR